MIKHPLIVTCLLLTAPLVGAAELTPVDHRRTDATHRADQATLQDIAKRIAALPETSPSRLPASAWLLVAPTRRLPWCGDLEIKNKTTPAKKTPMGI